jgi:hypothetical protein
MVGEFIDFDTFRHLETTVAIGRLAYETKRTKTGEAPIAPSFRIHPKDTYYSDNTFPHFRIRIGAWQPIQEFFDLFVPEAPLVIKSRHLVP